MLNIEQICIILCIIYLIIKMAIIQAMLLNIGELTQGDTANVTEMNLALALQNNSNVKSVDFTTVWGQGHTTAERTGDSTTNFINWVNECLK